MLRITLASLLALAVLTGYALAADDWDDETNVIRADVAHVADSAAPPAHSTHSAAQPAATPDKATLGSFLGAGDQFNETGLPAGDETSTAPSDNRGTGSYDIPATQPEGGISTGNDSDGEGGYASENVFGPMWGVPDDAKGLDEYRAATADHNHGQANAHQGGAAGDQKAGVGDDSGSNRGRGLENHKINRDDPNDW